MTTTFSTVDQLTLDADAIEAHARACATAARDLEDAEEALSDAEAEVSAIRTRAAKGQPAAPSALVNAEAGVVLAEDRVKGATTRKARMASKSVGVTDLDYAQAMAPELSGIFDGMVPIVWGLGKAPATLPEDLTAPVIVVTQSKNAEVTKGLGPDSLKGELSIRYFHNPLHIPLSQELLEKQISESASRVVRNTLDVKNVRSIADGSAATIKASVIPLYPYIHNAATEGEKWDKPCFTDVLWDKVGRRFGMTDGPNVYATVSRVKNVDWALSQYTHIESVSVDDRGIQTVTAKVESGWWMGEPLDYSNQIDKNHFPHLMDKCGDRILGEVDATLGRIVDVEYIDCQQVGGNSYGVTMIVKAEGILK